MSDLLVPDGVDTVTKFLVAVGLIVLGSHALGAILARLHQPRVVGEIVGGLLIGPSALGAVWPEGQQALFTGEVLGAIEMAAQLGLVLFMFLLGAELRVDMLRGHGGSVGFVVIGAMCLPFLAGVGLTPLLGERMAGPSAPTVAFVLFFGLALSITALPVLARILAELGLESTRLGTIALTSAAGGDVVAWTVLTMVLALSGAATMAKGVTMIVALAVFLLFAIVAVRPGMAMLLRFVGRRRSGANMTAPLLVVGALAFASILEVIGLHAVLGGFLFGVIIPRDLPEVAPVSTQFQGFTTVILLPLFFAGVGLKTSVALIGSGWVNWALFALVLLAAIGSKYAGAFAGGRLAGLPRNELFPLGALMNCRGVTELVVASIGLQYHLINQLGFTVLVLVALITTALTGPTVRVWMRSRSAQHLDAA